MFNILGPEETLASLCFDRSKVVNLIFIVFKKNK